MEELKSIVERIEAINETIETETLVRKDVYQEARSRGYCTKTIRKIVALRKRNADEIAEADAIEAMYREAVGLPT
jgi:uncharacterized protein (UPF0335 family)